MSKLGEIYLKNTEKALAILESHLQGDEEVMSLTTALWKPTGAKRLIPIVGNSTKKYLLGLTNKNLHVIRLKLIKIEEVSAEVIPLNQIEKVDARGGVWDKLKFNTKAGKKYSFHNIADTELALGLAEMFES